MRFNKIIGALLLHIGFIGITNAQVDGSPVEFDTKYWKDSTALTPLTEAEKEFKGVILKDYHIKTFSYGSFYSQLFDQYIPEISLEKNVYYKRIRLNNDAAVEMYNKVYISNNANRTVSNLKARAITKDGKIINFDDSNKKEIENYENAGPFIIFALEGIEVGSEIEFTYTTEEPSYENFCFSMSLQGSFPKRHVHYEIISPDYLVFKTKSYNGLIEAVNDTIIEDQNRYVLDIKNMKKFNDEKYTLGNALLQKIEVKLHENTNSNKRNFYSWTTAATNVADAIYIVDNAKTRKKEQKAIKKLIKKVGLHKITDTREQIVTLEHYLKKNIALTGRQGLKYIHEVVKHGQISSTHATRLYALVFKQLGIDHQVVLTSDRFSSTFDPKFESYNFLEQRFIYIPKLDQYLDASNELLRLGLIPSNYAYTQGLFLKTIDVGGITSAFPEIKPIAGTNSNVNYDNLTVDINFTENLEKINAHMKHVVNGYSAAYLRPYLGYLDEEQKTELLEERLKQIGEDAVISNITTDNDQMEGYMLENPFIFEGDAIVNSLIENAGNKLLLKVGQIIGAQVEMYQENEREFGVENSYNHGYNRVINITIPEGYKITNLDDLNMDVFSSNGKKRIMEFTSSYTLNGNVLTVTCNEYYDEIRFPIEKFEEFKKVINAAADFNKITLILEKV